MVDFKLNHKENGKHLIIYDRLWWIQGQRALLLQKYHPYLEIMSYYDFMDMVNRKGVQTINQTYEVISTLGLWTAERLIRRKIHVHSAVAGSYSYLAQNQDHFREWMNEIKLNDHYGKEILSKIDRIGAVNRKLAATIQRLCPEKQVDFMRPFVETDKFQPAGNHHDPALVIGWVGNAEKQSKNYHTTYQVIKDYFKHDPAVIFKEATKQARIAREDMPAFYQSIDLLLVTGMNEGLPNPAMEAYSCGIPILGTNIGIIKEWASSHAKSLILDSADPKPFIMKINQLKTKKDDLAVLGQEIRQHIVNHWGVEPNIFDWLDTLFQIGGEAR